MNYKVKEWRRVRGTRTKGNEISEGGEELKEVMVNGEEG